MTEMLTSEPRLAEPDAAEENAIRPFDIDVPEDELVAGTRTLLGDRVRLAQVRGEAEGSAALHHRDRWAGHPFHSRSLEA